MKRQGRKREGCRVAYCWQETSVVVADQIFGTSDSYCWEAYRRDWKYAMWRRRHWFIRRWSVASHRLASDQRILSKWSSDTFCSLATATVDDEIRRLKNPPPMAPQLTFVCNCVRRKYKLAELSEAQLNNYLTQCIVWWSLFLVLMSVSNVGLQYQCRGIHPGILLVHWSSTMPH